MEHCGVSPCPWLVNVGHTCYIDSVVISLFHCTDPQEQMRTMPRTSHLRAAFQDILRDYADGIVEPAGAAPGHWDVPAPCRPVDAVDEASRRVPGGHDLFDIGPLHGAAPFLGFLLDQTGMGATCFAAHTPGHRGADLPVRRDDALTPPDAVNPDTRPRLGDLVVQNLSMGLLFSRSCYRLTI